MEGATRQTIRVLCFLGPGSRAASSRMTGHFRPSMNISTSSAVPEPERLVMKRLAKIAQTDIVKSVRIVERMVKGDREGWRIHGWQEPARAILEQAVKAGVTARSEAEQV